VLSAKKMVFLSYSSRNSKEAEYIYSTFVEAGLEVWFAPKSIEAGSDYGESIINAIEDTSILVLILSKDANKSDHVLAEVEIAFKYKKPIFTVRIEDVLPTKSLEYRISTKQWVDLFQDFNINLLQFIQTVKRKLELKESTNEKLQEKTSEITFINHSYSVVVKPINIEKYLKEAILIDQQYYNEDLVGVLQTCIQWYEASNEIYTFVVDKKDKVVAYYNAMLIDEDIFKKNKRRQILR
jgi:hypothetical protein